MNKDNYKAIGEQKTTVYRKKTFFEKLGEFIGGCIVFALVLALIGAFVGDDDTKRPDTVRENPFRSNS